METTLQIAVQKTRKSRVESVDFNNLGFGKIVTDHMFIAEYKNGIWDDMQIIPFGNLSMAPHTLAFHYGQTVFEGLKAFRRVDGKISIFRLDRHHQRINRSLERMCMPEIPYDVFADSVKQLVMIDEQWLRPIKGTSLYIRPFVIATEERFGVKVSDNYKFIVFAGAVGDYYNNPLKVKIEDQFIRASKGGTGFAKCGGNYGGAFLPTHLANIQGFDQVLWTDGSSELNIEESGTMNVMFVIDGKIVTPALSDTILSGVTRDSLLKLATDMGYKTEERKISSFEFRDKLMEGRVNEAFGTGTAAVTTPITSISIRGIEYQLPQHTNESFMRRATEKLTQIRLGILPDKHDWNTVL